MTPAIVTNAAGHLKITFAADRSAIHTCHMWVDATARRKQTATIMMGASRWNRAAAAVIVAAILYLPALGRPPLLEPDEGRYAEIAREMNLTADYVTPRNDWVRYFEKPPLVYWITAGTIRILGPDEFAVRMQAALFSAGQVGLTEILGEAMFGATAGVLAAIALMLAPIFMGFARFATLDPALSFFVTAAMTAFFSGSDAGFASRKGRSLAILAAVLLAFGTLAKGPVALVIGGAIAFIYLPLTGRARELLKLPWLGATLLYVMIVAPWFVAAAWANPGFLRFFFLHEHVQRYLASTEHGWGPYFFVVVAAAGTWPWLYFAVDAAIRLWRPASYKDGDAHTAGLPAARRSLIFLLAWFFFVLIFFSIPRSKLGSYILPAIPPVAILAGYGMREFIRRAPSRRFIGGFALINGSLAIAAAVLLIAIEKNVPVSIVADGAVAAGALMFIAVAPAIAARAGWRRWALVSIAIGVILMATAAARAREDGAAYNSYRRLAGVIAPRLASGCFLGSYGHFVQSIPFYTGSREALIDFRGELDPFSGSDDAAASFVDGLPELDRIWSTSRCAVVIVNLRDLHKVVAALQPPPSIIACEGKKVALYNRPVEQAPAMFDCQGTFAFKPGVPATRDGVGLR